MKTYHPKEKDIQRNWYVVDLKGKVLGRVATEMARRLMGKHKPQFSPAVDTGDFIIAVNADQIRLTGDKLTKKVYYYHTGAIGGIKEITASKLLQKDSTKMVKLAIKGMLPKNTLGRNMLKKLKVYKGAEHNHVAQNPQPLEI